MHIVNHIPLNFGVGYVKVVLDSGTAQREGLGGDFNPSTFLQE